MKCILIFSIYRWGDIVSVGSIKLIEPKFKFMWFMWIENMSYFYYGIFFKNQSLCARSWGKISNWPGLIMFLI